MKTATFRTSPTSHAPWGARDFVEGRLLSWGLSHLADDAKIVVSELVSNAVKASGGDAHIEVWLRADELCLFIEVWDTAPGIPLYFDAAVTDESGRGMKVVDAICGGDRRWGCAPATKGKVVWALVGGEAGEPAADALRAALA